MKLDEIKSLIDKRYNGTFSMIFTKLENKSLKIYGNCNGWFSINENNNAVYVDADDNYSKTIYKTIDEIKKDFC